VSGPRARERRGGQAGVVPVAWHPCVGEKAAKDRDYWVSWAGREHRGGARASRPWMGVSIVGRVRNEQNERRRLRSYHLDGRTTLGEHTVKWTACLAPGHPEASPVWTPGPVRFDVRDATTYVMRLLIRMLLLHMLACAQFLSGKQTRVAPVSSDAWSLKHESCNRPLSWT
jgi:hypothetical protein